MTTICIDSGHYGKYNRCPTNEKYYESEVMWKLHLLQEKFFRQLGLNVVTTRKKLEVDLDLIKRGEKSKGCNLFISNHSNAVGSKMNESVDYVTVYCLADDTFTKCDDISKEIANKIAPVIANIMNVKQGYRVWTKKCTYDRNNDGQLNDNYYGVLHGARSVDTPAILIEHSFHTNSKIVEWLLNDTNLEKLAIAECECIASYLTGKNATISDSKSKNNEKLYRVQVGAFQYKDNAYKLSSELKKSGFDNFVVKVGGLYKVQVGAYSVKTNAENMLKKIKQCGYNGFITN